jgi:hypothetical protein
MSYESLTYAELIDMRTKYCNQLRNSPPSQANTTEHKALAQEIAWINTQLIHTEIVNHNRL